MFATTASHPVDNIQRNIKMERFLNSPAILADYK